MTVVGGTLLLKILLSSIVWLPSGQFVLENGGRRKHAPRPEVYSQFGDVDDVESASFSVEMLQCGAGSRPAVALEHAKSLEFVVCADLERNCDFAGR